MQSAPPIAMVQPAGYPGAVRRLPLLDGLRGLAALLVLMLHFEALMGLRGVFERGYLAVDFFFMLSGFVLVPMFEQAPSPSGLIAMRLARLWPLMALGATIGLVGHALVWGFPAALPDYAMALIGIPRLQGEAMTYPLDQPEWSLVVELAINVLHLLVLRRLGLRGLLTVSAVCWVVLALAAARYGDLDLGSRGDTWGIGLLRAGFAYPLGIVLARCRDRLPRPGVDWRHAAIVLPGLLIGPTLLGLPAGFTDPVVIVLFVPVLALAAAADPQVPMPASLRWLGRISFPLYAIHFPVLELAHLLADDWPVALRAPALLAALALCLGLAHVLARSPLARGFSRVGKARRALNATA